MLRAMVFLSLILLPLFSAQAQVVVSIKPLHSLVASVMEGSGEVPLLLVDGKTSLHDFALKPSQAKALHEARLVFYISDGFEQFLAKIVPQLPAATKRVAMEEAEGMTLYPMRGGGVAAHDLHLWMSPDNAKAMVQYIARALSQAYPGHAALFSANAKKLDAKLALLDARLRARMAKIKDKPFVVFHDAYQYFDRAYGLQNIGAITLHPEHGLSAQRVSELREKIKATNAVCVFREPEFEGKIVDNLMQGTHAKSAVLDPEGALLTPGAELYFQLMEDMAGALENCLL